MSSKNGAIDDLCWSKGMALNLFMKRLVFRNACLWLWPPLLVTQCIAVTITGEIRVSSFPKNPGSVVDQADYAFQVSTEGEKWSLRVDYGAEYYELSGGDGSKTWTVNCSSDAEFKKSFGAGADRAMYPATVVLTPCSFAGTAAGRVVWLAFASSSLFASNSSPFLPALWGEPIIDPIANAIEISKAEFVEGSRGLPSRLEFVYSSRKLLENPRGSPYLSTTVPEATVRSAMERLKRRVEGHKFGLYSVLATTNLAGAAFPSNFQLDVLDPDSGDKLQTYVGTVDSVAAAAPPVFLAESLRRGLSVQDRRFRDQSRAIDMIRYPMTKGVWLETNDAALLRLFQQQQAGIVPISRGTSRAVRLAFFVFVAATLFPLVLWLRNRARRGV